tara:strand:+ start:382 stop:576 length:195 start_codon:yes stop_codon:yes gene_type:complete
MNNKSPCINICSIDKKTGLCLGCYRTLNEIALWAKLDDIEKNKIIFQLNNRKKVSFKLKKNFNL